MSFTVSTAHSVFMQTFRKTSSTCSIPRRCTTYLSRFAVVSLYAFNPHRVVIIATSGPGRLRRNPAMDPVRVPQYKQQLTTLSYWCISRGNGVVYGPGLLATLGEQHRKQRKMLNPVFSTAHMRDMSKPPVSCRLPKPSDINIRQCLFSTT